MGRSRSRSPPRRERRRSRSTSRERERRRRERSRSRDRDRRRSRSRSPHRRRSRSPRRHRSSSSSPPRLKERRDEEKKEIKDSKGKERQITEEDLQGKTEEEIEMMKMMGFASFDTTKGKKVDGAANAYAINVSQKRKYRRVIRLLGPLEKGKVCSFYCQTEAVHEQKRRIQQTPGFHRLTLGSLGGHEKPPAETDFASSETRFPRNLGYSQQIPAPQWVQVAVS